MACLLGVLSLMPAQSASLLGIPIRREPQPMDRQTCTAEELHTSTVKQVGRISVICRAMDGVRRLVVVGFANRCCLGRLSLRKKDRCTNSIATRRMLHITVILSAKGMDARSETCDRIHKNHKVQRIALSILQNNSSAVSISSALELQTRLFCEALEAVYA